MEMKSYVSNNEKAYKAPAVKVIEFSAESLICQSPGEGTGENGGMDGGFGGEE